MPHICVHHGQQCEEVGGGLEGMEAGNGEEQRGILITSTAAPAISTYETDRAKRQLMQQYPGGEPALSHLDARQQPPD